MRDKFSAAGDAQQRLIAEAMAWAEHGAMMSFAVTGVATCLISLIGDRARHDDDILRSVSPTLYHEARAIAPDVLAEDEEMSEEFKDSNEIMDFTAERAWPLTLCSAIYERHGCDHNGYVEGSEHPIMYMGEDFPPALRRLQIDVAQEIEEECRAFIEAGTEKIEAYLQYPTKINPLWLFLAIEEAQKVNIQVSDDLRTWMPGCLDKVMGIVHAARREDGMDIKKMYN